MTEITPFEYALVVSRKWRETQGERLSYELMALGETLAEADREETTWPVKWLNLNRRFRKSAWTLERLESYDLKRVRSQPMECEDLELEIAHLVAELRSMGVENPLDTSAIQDSVKNKAMLQAQVGSLIKLKYSRFINYQDVYRRKSALLWMNVFCCGVVVLILGSWIVYFNRTESKLPSIPILGLSMIIGGVGGFVFRIAPALRSLEQSPTAAESESLRYYTTNLLLAPLSGAIFSAALFLLFASGLLKSELFPQLTVASADEVKSIVQRTIDLDAARLKLGVVKDKDSAKRLDEIVQERAMLTTAMTKAFLAKGTPSSGEDFAKLTIWSFIAGFIPNVVPTWLRKRGETIS